MEDRKVIIVGAGIGGLGAGYWLKEQGYDVEILESNDYPGGRMKTMEYRGDKVDVGTVFYHSDYKLAYELIDAARLTHMRKKINGLIKFRLKNGSSFDYDHRIPYLKLLGPIGNIKVGLFILKYIIFGKKFRKYWIERDIPEWDNMPVRDLFKGIGSAKVYDYLVGMVSMGENMGDPEYMSVYHFIHLFRLTTFTNFIGLRGGTASLAEALGKMLPVTYDSPVEQVVMENGRCVGVKMKGSKKVKRAGHVIVATDPAAAGRLMPDELKPQQDFFNSVTYSPFPAVVLFLDRALDKDVWIYFNDIKEKRPFLVCIDQLAKMPEMVPSGKSVLMMAAGHPDTLALQDLSDEELIEMATQDAEAMIPGASKMVEHGEVFRHPFGVARFPVGAYKKVIDFKESIEDLKGLSFVGDIFGGHYVEASLESAKKAVLRVGAWGGTTK